MLPRSLRSGNARLPTFTALKLERRFKIAVVQEAGSTVFVALEPQLAIDADTFRRIDVALSSETSLPVAVRFTDSAVTKQSTFVFRSRHVNFCPEAVQWLFEPDLEGYTVLEDTH